MSPWFMNSRINNNSTSDLDSEENIDLSVIPRPGQSVQGPHQPELRQQPGFFHSSVSIRTYRNIDGVSLSLCSHCVLLSTIRLTYQL